MISTKKEVGLVKTFEEVHHIWTIAEVIAFYQKAFPDMDIIKIKLSYKGQFLRYKIIGQDLTIRQTLQMNAQTGGVLTEESKYLSPKECANQENEFIQIDNLLSLNEITAVAKSIYPDYRPYKGEIKREHDQTIYQIDLVDDHLEYKAVLKVDAQDGTVLNSIEKNK